MNHNHKHAITLNAMQKSQKRPKNSQIGAWFALLVLIAALAAVSTAEAQNRPNFGNNNANYGGNTVVMFSECGFRGTSQQVGIGEHSKIQNLRFPNDDMSSIRIPAGLEVTLYEDSKFRGGYARLTQDVACFDQSWDNSVSSIKVTSTGGYNPGYPNPGQPLPGQPGVNVNNVSYVSFANSELRKINNNTWSLGTMGQYNSMTNYNVVSRDATSLFMQSQVSNERLRVDLAANRVTYYAVNGAAQDFPIQQKQPGPVTTDPIRPLPPVLPGAGNEPNRRISGRCFTYRAYTRGGDGGLRFHGKSNVERFTTRPATGEVCHSGSLTMEITKTAPNTEVVVEIQGRQFRFGANETADRFETNWYRKDVRLVVGN